VQERSAVGYSIVTVDGSRVSVSYYSAPVETTPGQMRGEISQWKTPETWIRQDTFAYSLNGRQFLVKKGESFKAVGDAIAKGDGFIGTSMAILDGTNNDAGTTLDDKVQSRRDLANMVTTGWFPRPDGCHSDALSLWGMRDALGSDKCDRYVLALSYDPAVPADKLLAGRVAICRKDDAGQWVSAASNGSFVVGPYRPGAEVGDWGVDAVKHLVWAVLDREGDFVVSMSAKQR